MFVLARVPEEKIEDFILGVRAYNKIKAIERVSIGTFNFKVATVHKDPKVAQRYVSSRGNVGYNNLEAIPEEQFEQFVLQFTSLATKGKVEAYVLIHVDQKKTQEVRDELRKLSEVISAEAVTGPYDIVARVSTGSVEELGAFLLETLKGMDGPEKALSVIVMNV